MVGWVRQSSLVKNEALIVMEKGGGGGLKFNVEQWGDGLKRERTINQKCVEWTSSPSAQFK